MVSDFEIERLVETRVGARTRVVDRQPSRFATSHDLEEVTVVTGRHPPIGLLRKALGSDGLVGEAVALREHLGADIGAGATEAFVYEAVLHSIAGPPSWFGTAAPAGGPAWMLLEHVDGQELYQVADLERWCDAARWLGRFHARLRPRAAAIKLPRRDSDWHLQWFNRARANDTSGRVDALGPLFVRVVERVGAMPVTVVHGDFYASNVLVGDDRRVTAVDWERAALGAGLLDLAALVAGWDEAGVARMLAAYIAGLVCHGRVPLRAGDVARDLDCCRMCVAMQWLGWPASWSPPREHRADWLGDAEAAARRLALA